VSEAQERARRSKNRIAVRPRGRAVASALCWRRLTDEANRLWFETEEEFFTAASKCASLYFLPERRIFFPDTSLFAPGQHETAQKA
jgi:hypothetical protein